MDAFDSLETFCAADMETLFTVPSAVDFNLTAWQMQFCGLNLTVLMEELAEYQGTQDIANIVSIYCSERERGEKERERERERERRERSE